MKKRFGGKVGKIATTGELNNFARKIQKGIHAFNKRTKV